MFRQWEREDATLSDEERHVEEERWRLFQQGALGSVVMSKPVELYTASGCPFIEAARDDLEWRGVAFVEYDVERDAEARARLLALTGGDRTVPVIVEEGRPVQVGWMGRGCAV